MRSKNYLKIANDLAKELLNRRSVRSSLELIFSALEKEFKYKSSLLVVDFEKHIIKSHLVNNEALMIISKIIPLDNKGLSLDYNAVSEENNAVVRSFKSKAPVFTNSFHEIINPIISKNLADKIQSLIRINHGLVFPIIANKRVYGLVTLGSRKQFTNDEIVSLQSFIEIAGIALENSLYLNKIQKSNIALQRQIQKERDIIDIMGHELRTPMSVIKLQFSMVKRAVKNDPILFSAVEKNITQIDSSLRHQIDLINTIIQVTKVDSGNLELNFDKIPAKEIIENTKIAFTPEAQKKNLTLQIEETLLNTDLQLRADKVSLQEIIDNLVSNAIKYTQTGTVTLTHTNDENFIYITVKDTGGGISPEEIPNLGKKFFRARQYLDSNNQTNVVRPGGTGLGLYIVFSLVKKHGGEVKVQSELGKGTEFTISIPIYKKGDREKVNKTKSLNVFERLKS